MRRFKDVRHLPISPKFWTAPNGRKIEWRSDRQPFEQFMAVVVEYHNANALPPPTREQVEDTLCRQMASWACVDASFHTAGLNDPVVVSSQRSSGCRACGKR